MFIFRARMFYLNVCVEVVICFLRWSEVLSIDLQQSLFKNKKHTSISLIKLIQFQCVLNNYQIKTQCHWLLNRIRLYSVNRFQIQVGALVSQALTPQIKYKIVGKTKSALPTNSYPAYIVTSLFLH